MDGFLLSLSNTEDPDWTNGVTRPADGKSALQCIMPGRFGLLHGSCVRLTEEYLERSYIDLVWPELCERRMVVAFSARLLNSDGLWPRSYFERRKTIVEPDSRASFECGGIRT